MAAKLPRDFAEFLSSLNSHRVRYLLIGGYAVGVHGHVRATNDIDIWIEATTENAKRLEAALREFGFDVPELAATKLIEPGTITRLGTPPMRIELLSSISGITFEAAYPNRIESDFDGLVVPVIGLDDLLTNKRSTGRTKDLADVEELAPADKA
jgi:predicted nucleotidyltransferase